MVIRQVLEEEDINFEDTNFGSSEFLNTVLKGIDFSSCNISDIGVSPNDVKGIVVNVEQALMLISLLGIIVK